jgi:hypothetical protein
MKLSDLTDETITRIRRVRYDSFIEKHEGPWDWDGVFRCGDPDVLRVEDRFDVLLPIDKAQHPNITVVRCTAASDGSTLTLFLKDTTNYLDTRHERFDAGRVAICDRFENENFFVAIFYHVWYMTF